MHEQLDGQRGMTPDESGNGSSERRRRPPGEWTPRRRSAEWWDQFWTDALHALKRHLEET
jgi:hypothetical protein